jgi:hypothetical protein
MRWTSACTSGFPNIGQSPPKIPASLTLLWTLADIDLLTGERPGFYQLQPQRCEHTKRKWNSVPSMNDNVLGLTSQCASVG